MLCIEHRQQQNDSITDMLTYLNWPSLEDQRKVSHLILLFKIVRKLFIVSDRCLPASAPLQSTRPHHSLKLAHKQSRNDIYKYSFLPIEQSLHGMIWTFKTLTK